MTTTTTIYERIGGKPAVETVVDDFYARIMADDSLLPFFAGTDMAKQKRHQTAFVAMAIGGPRDYTGKGMREAHQGRSISTENFGAVAGHLTAALSAAGVTDEDVAAIISVVATLKDEVVEE